MDIGALVAGIGAVLKSFHSDRNSNESKKALDALLISWSLKERK